MSNDITTISNRGVVITRADLDQMLEQSTNSAGVDVGSRTLP